MKLSKFTLFKSTKSSSFEDIFERSKLCSTSIQDFMAHKLTENFANSFIENFDYYSIFHRESDFNYKFNQSVNWAYTQIYESIYGSVPRFMDVIFYLVEHDGNYYLAFQDDYNKEIFNIIIDQNLGFIEIKNGADMLLSNFIDLPIFKQNALSFVGCSIELLNIKNNWYRFLPDQSIRIENQIFFLISHTIAKTEKLSLMATLELQKTFTSHPQYSILKEKVTKVIEKNTKILDSKQKELNVLQNISQIISSTAKIPNN